jgi:hypothetical protein
MRRVDANSILPPAPRFSSKETEQTPDGHHDHRQPQNAPDANSLRHLTHAHRRKSSSKKFADGNDKTRRGRRNRNRLDTLLSTISSI